MDSMHRRQPWRRSFVAVASAVLLFGTPFAVFGLTPAPSASPESTARKTEGGAESPRRPASENRERAKKATRTPTSPSPTPTPPPPTATPTPTPTIPAFSFEDLQQRAKALAARSYSPPETTLPAYLQNLRYDAFRAIRFRPERALWRNEGLPFEVQFFHLGFLYRDPVRIHVIQSNRVEDVQFRPEMFDYGYNQFPEPVPADIGFAGFRIHFALNRADYRDEVAVFLGASYFRILGAGQVYGLSARGLAIDTALPAGEEFPRFSEFWIERPRPDATALTVYALLESESVTGAYRFVIHPGKETLSDVDTHLYARQRVAKLGIAPLTSMYLFGEERSRFVPDFRPEVHDSDGLLIGNRTGEWSWRPVANPERWHRVSRFQNDDSLGFALLQRDRDFASYQDLESHYEQRPSYWVEPVGNWGKGAVELVEIPSDSETNDNLVAYWVPDGGVERGSEFHYSYRLHAYLNSAERPPVGRTQATRLHPGYQGKTARFVLDFYGPWLPSLPENAPVVADVVASRGEISNVVVHKNPMTAGWRTFFDLNASKGDPVELRASLRLGPRQITETWMYRWDFQ